MDPATTSEYSIARSALGGVRVFLWHYLHADWQWEQSRRWHEERYAFAMSVALDAMSRNPEVGYVIDTALEYLVPVCARLGTRLQELRQRVAEGRVVVVSGQMAGARPTQIGGETFIRNLQIGQTAFHRLLGVQKIRLFLNADTAIGHSQLPQVLTSLGFEYYRSWRPHEAMNVQGIPHQFVWRGLDGSEIVVTRGCYGGLFKRSGMPWRDRGSGWEDTLVELYSEYFKDQLDGSRSPTGALWLVQGGDDVIIDRTWDGDEEVGLEELVATWREHEVIPLNWSTPVAFSDAVKERSEQLAILEGPLDTCDCAYNMGNGGSNGLWRWRLLNDRRLVEAERWVAVAAALGGSALPLRTLERLWTLHLTYQGHAQEFAFEEDRRELHRNATVVEVESEEVINDCLNAIGFAASGGEWERDTYYVFNSNPWSVQAEALIRHVCPVAGTTSIEVVDGTGRSLPQQPVDTFRHGRFAGSVNEVAALVRVAVPPMGYRRLRVREIGDGCGGAREARRSESENAQRWACGADSLLETSRLAVSYRGGCLETVVDKLRGVRYEGYRGVPWVGLSFHTMDEATWEFNQQVVAINRFIASAAKWVETGPLRWRHRAEGEVGPYTASVETVITYDRPEIEIEVCLDGSWEEPDITGFVALEVGVGVGGAMRTGIPFGVESRQPEKEAYVGFERSLPGVFWGSSWVDWGADRRHVTVISRDGGWYWYRKDGYIGHVMARCIRLRRDSWEVRCDGVLKGGGVHRFGYVVRLNGAEEDVVGLQRRSAEIQWPFRVVARGRAAGLLTGGEALLIPANEAKAEEMGVLSLEGPVVMSSWYVGEDGYILRCYEARGTGGRMVARLNSEVGSAVAVDLRGAPVRDHCAVVVEGTEIAVDVKPWEIVTLRVTLAREDEMSVRMREGANGVAGVSE